MLVMLLFLYCRCCGGSLLIWRCSQGAVLGAGQGAAVWVLLRVLVRVLLGGSGCGCCGEVLFCVLRVTVLVQRSCPEEVLVQQLFGLLKLPAGGAVLVCSAQLFWAVVSSRCCQNLHGCC